ncbi:YiiD C-terminal domain-containing protein [Methylophaga sp. OBS4]|uniref:YiiD C-terminal domain-containing protein n=1 Tax=Methylophaga sp. OBS4 TaxID=2991935 RepID=UPI0022526967|nr:YiiD C-terminal domain-containing protein [Methylophaga sp. OBS4]MCX4188158.1 thioesterase domain-containing protein [Methylophaga sp. OBS4]
MNLDEVNAYIHKQIPLTSALAVTVASYDSQSVKLDVPLTPNLNHRDTAFGGSLAAVGILAGWSLLFIKFKEMNLSARLVIQKSQFDFTAPVDSDFHAICSLPDDKHWQLFLNTFQRRGRARITLRSQIEFAGNDGGKHEGVYVAVRLQTAEQDSIIK